MNDDSAKERADAAERLESLAHEVLMVAGGDGREVVADLRRAADLLRQPPPPPAAGVSKEAVKVLAVQLRSVIASCNNRKGREGAISLFVADIEALPEAAPPVATSARGLAAHELVCVKVHNAAIESAALIACPEPHVEEEVECSVVAERIRSLKRAYRSAEVEEMFARRELLVDLRQRSPEEDRELDGLRRAIMELPTAQSPADQEASDFIRRTARMLAAPPSGVDRGADRPTVVCLCGSTRFYEQFQAANYERTMRGEIVLSVGFYMHAPQGGHGEGVGHDSAEKVALDELHKRKIDLADYVLVVSDATGYFGTSTASEIRYAVEHGKPVEFAVVAAAKRAQDEGLLRALPEAKP